MGGFLALSIAMAALTKQFSEAYASKGKKPFIYGSFSSIIASALAYLASFATNNLFTVYWIITALFIVFGSIHMVMVHKKYFYARKDNQKKVMTGEVMFAISVVLFTIVVFSSLQYFLQSRDYLFFPMMMSVLGFFIPLMLVHTFDAAYGIPSPTYPTWQYPTTHTIEVPDEDPREKLLVIGFEIAKKATDFKKTYFRAKAPEGIKLGELYYHFINDYNEIQSETTIDIMNQNGEVQEWLFRVKPKWNKPTRILDPLLSVRENKIKENTVIVCERVAGE